MNTKKEFLLIGGSRDGDRIKIDPIPYLKVAILPKIGTIELPSIHSIITEETYVLSKFSDGINGENVYEVYVLVGITNPIERLIRFYRP